MTVDTAEVIASLTSQAYTHEGIHERAAELTAPGLYAWWLLDAESVTSTMLASLQAGACLYVGQTDDLAERLLGDHFEGCSSGSSAPRRSLGAVLRDALDLQVYARGRGRSPKDAQHYAFSKDDEAALSRWLRQHVEVSLWRAPLGLKLKPLERVVIAELRPVLNDDSPHPLAREVCEARACCRRLAAIAGPRR